MRDAISLSDILALFGRRPDDLHFVGVADSQEYLALVQYLVSRSSRDRA